LHLLYSYWFRFNLKYFKDCHSLSTILAFLNIAPEHNAHYRLRINDDKFGIHQDNENILNALSLIRGNNRARTAVTLW